MKPGHIADAQTELASTSGFSRTAAVRGDLPEHIGPLGITGQKHHPGLGQRQGGIAKASLHFGQGDGGFNALLASAELLLSADCVQQFVFGFAAVESHAQVACNAAKLPKSQARKRRQGLVHHFRFRLGSLCIR